MKFGQLLKSIFVSSCFLILSFSFSVFGETQRLKPCRRALAAPVLKALQLKDLPAELLEQNDLDLQALFNSYSVYEIEKGSRRGTFTILQRSNPNPKVRQQSSGTQIEILGRYVEDEVHSLGRVEGDERLQIEIEKVTTLFEKTTSYSATLLGGHSYRDKLKGPSLKEFIERARKIDGFKLTRRQSDTLTDSVRFENKSANLILKWIRFKDLVMVGVFEENANKNLNTLINKDLPRMVKVFNQIYYEHKIEPHLVTKVTSLARHSP